MNIEKIKKQNYSVAIYIRLSKEDGDKEESESVINQRKILRSFAQENGYQIYDEYVDDGYTGTNFNRPSFQRMIKDIEDKKINMVITKSLSRLGRDYIETGRYVETYFPENEIRYIALLDDVDTFLDKNCDTVAFKNVMNDMFAKETSKNIKKTKNKKKKEGFYYTPYAPFGYRKISKSGLLEIDEIQAKVVRNIFSMFLNGKGTYQIAETLTKNNIVPPGINMKMASVMNNITETTDKWNHNTVRRILENQSYIGNCVQNKTKKISYKSKKMLKIPEEQQTIIQNHHEAIINEETWIIVQKMLKNHKNTKTRENDALFKGILFCSHCNNRLSIRTKIDKYKNKETIRKYIYCNTANKKLSNKKCYKQYVNYCDFEKCALEKISQTLEVYINSSEFQNEKILTKLLEKQGNKGKLIEKGKNLKSDLEKVNKKIAVLYSDKLNGLIEQQDYIMFSENLIKERHRIEDLINEIENDIKKFEINSTNNKLEKEMQDSIKNIVKSKEYTKEIIYQLINKIEIDKEKNVVIYFNFYELNCIGGQTDVKRVCNL